MPKKVTANGKTFTFDDNVSNDDIGHAIDDYFAANKTAPQQVQAPPAQQQSPTAEQAIAHFQNAIALGGAVTQKPQAQPEDNGGGVWSGGEQVQHQPNAANPLLYNELVETPQYQQAVKEHAAKQEEANRNYAANFDISKHQFENKAVPSGTAISYGVNDLANKIQQGAATDEEKRNYEFLKPIADKETNFINNKYKEEGIVNFGKTDAEQRGGKDAQLAQLADDYYKTLQEGKPTLGILDKIHSINPNWRYDDSQNNPQKAAQIDDLYKSSIIRYKMAQDKFKEAESKLHELQDNGAGIFSASKKLTGNYDDLSMSNDMLGGQFFPEVQQYNAAKQELAQAHQNAYALYRNAVLKEDIGGEHENQVAHQGFINKYVGEPLKNVIGGAAKGAANMLNMYGTGGGQSQFGLNPNIDVAQNLKQDYQQNNIAVPQNLKDAASKPISQSIGEIGGSLPIFLGKQAPMALALGAGMNLVGEAAGVGALEGEGGAIQQMLKSPDLATKMNGVIASSYLEGTKFALGSGKPEDFEMGMKYGLAGSLGGALTKIVANNKYLVELSKIAPKTAAILGGVGGQAAGTAAMLGSAEGLGFAKAGVDYMTNQTTFKEALKNAGIDTDNLSDYSKNLIAQFAVFGLSHGLAPIKEAKNEQSLARLKEAKDNMIKSGVPEHEAEQIVQAAQPHEEKPTQTEVPTETKINEPINEVKPIEVKANDTVDNALAETQQHDEQLKNNTYEPTDTQSEVVNSAIEETGNPPQDEAEQRKQLDIINTALTKGTESIGNQAANNPEGGSAAPESVGGETEGGQGNAAETEIGSVGVGGDKSILDSDVDLKGDKKGGYEREHLNHVKTELSKKDESKIAEVANELHPGNPEIAKGLIDFVKATIKIINSKLAKEVEENKKNGVPKNFSATTNEVTFGLKDLNSDDFFPKDLGGSDRFLKGNKYYSDAVHILKQIGYDINSPSNWMQSDARIRNAHNIQGALNFYKNFEGDNHFVRDIKKGILTATDAKTIIESAGLEVPKEIAEQSLKETPKAGSGGVVDVDFTAKGGNKVVDEKGNPITVYHVSNNPDIKVFKTEGTIEVVGNKNVPNHGAYFSPNKGKYKHKGEHEYAVNLKMANPFITTDQIYSAIITPEKFADLKAKGHDGVILMRNGKPDEYIVFDNSQIKQSFKENNLNQNTNEKANEVREIESRQGQPENERGQPIRGKERQEANAEKEKVGQGEATPQSSLPRSRKNRIELVKKSEPLDLRTAVLKFFIEGGKLHQDEVVTELGLGNRDKYNSGKKISSPTELISRNWMIDHEPIKAGEKRKTIDQQILGNPMFENYDPQKVRDMFIEVMTDHTQKDKMIDEYLHQQRKMDFEAGMNKYYDNTIPPPTPHEEMVYGLDNLVHLTPEEQDLLPTLEDGIGNLTKEEQAHLLSLYDEWQNSRSIEEIRNEANELTQKIKDNEAELNRQAENLDNGNGINKRNAQAKPISETKIITTKPTDNATKEIKQQKSVPGERESGNQSEQADKTISSNSVLGAEKGEEEIAPTLVGVSHASLEKQAKELGADVPIRGSYRSKTELADIGRKILPKTDIKEFERKIKENLPKDSYAPSNEDISIARAYEEKLQKDLRNPDISDEEKTKIAEELKKWQTEIVKPIGTKSGESFFSLGGERDIITDNFHENVVNFEVETGRPPTKAEKKKIEELTTQVKSLTKDLEDAKKTIVEKIDKAHNSEASKSDTETKKKYSDYTKKAADNFRKLKTKAFIFKDENGNEIQVHTAGITWNDAIEAGAKIIEATGNIADAIEETINKLKDSSWYHTLSDNDKERLKNEIETTFKANTEEGKKITRLEKQLEKLLKGEFPSKRAKTDDSERAKELRSQIYEAKKDLGLISSKELPQTEEEKFKEFQGRMAGKKGDTFTPQDAKNVWSLVKKEIDNGEDFSDAISKVSDDLGLSFMQVSKAITTPKSLRNVTHEMYLVQNKRNQALSKARHFIDDANKSVIEKGIQKAGNIFFQKAVALHGTVAPITHAGTMMFKPNLWKEYATLMKNTYKNAFAFTDKSLGNYEAAMDALKHDPQFAMWKSAGLAIDPSKTSEDDYTFGERIMGRKISGMGERGFNALKVARLDVAKKLYETLTSEEKSDTKLVKQLAEFVNNATGTSKFKPTSLAQAALFAPKLYVSRLNRVYKEPLTIANTLVKMAQGKASTSEKAMAKIMAKDTGYFLGTYFAALLANQAILSAIGSKQSINFTNYGSKDNDWLKFKGGDKTFDLTGGMRNEIQTLASLAALAIQGEKKGKEKDKLSNIATNYVLTKSSPLISMGLQFGLLHHDIGGNTLPTSDENPAYKSARKLSWKDYLEENQLNIPLDEYFKTVHDAMKEKGMSEAQVNDVLNGIFNAAVTGITGIHVAKDRSLPDKQQTPFIDLGSN